MSLKISDFINEYNFDYLLKKIRKINTIIKIFTHFLFYFAIVFLISNSGNFIFFILWTVFYIFIYENRFDFYKYLILNDKNFYNFIYDENFNYTKQVALKDFLQKLKSITDFDSSFLYQKLDDKNLKTEENFLKFLHDLDQEIKQNQKIIIFNPDFDFADTLLTRFLGPLDGSKKARFKAHNQNVTFSFIFKNFFLPIFIVILMLFAFWLFGNFIYLDFFRYVLYFVFVLIFFACLKYFFFYKIIEKINSKIPFYNYYFNEWLILEEKIKFYFANWHNFSKKNDYNSLLFASLIDRVNQNIAFRSEFLQEIEKSQKYKKYIYYPDLEKLLDLQKIFLKENSIFIQKVVSYWSEKNVEFNQNLISDLSENSNFSLHSKRLEVLNQNLGKLQK